MPEKLKGNPPPTHPGIQLVVDNRLKRKSKRGFPGGGQERPGGEGDGG